MPNLGANLTTAWINGPSISPARRLLTADVNGSGVNFTEAEGPVNAIIQIGNLSAAVATFTVTLTESTNDNTADAFGAADAYAALPVAASVVITEPGAENTVTVLTTFARSERWVRANVAHTGSAALQNIYGVSLHSPSKSY